jgi:DNA-binding NtrC family response regulator
MRSERFTPPRGTEATCIQKSKPQIGFMASSIVLVDDDQGFADVLAEVLRVERHTVLTFPTPDEALKWLLNGNKADVVLLDLHTPGMSAERFQETLRSVVPLRDLPIVIISGDPDLNAVADAMGVEEAISKPVDIERLLAAIDHTQHGTQRRKNGMIH